jgi:DNA-directed RNA polymerase specialized sigma24 family protein
MRALTPGALDALLAQLDPDRERAAVAYEALHARLVRLFEWRAAGDAGALADETLDRVARRLEEGLEIRARDPFHYVAGVAHFVLKEVARRAEREKSAAREFASAPPPLREGARLRCLDGCLERLPDDQRRLVLGYYAGDGSARIAGRTELAEEKGIDRNALRVRVHRLRQGLEECLGQCLKEQRE